METDTPVFHFDFHVEEVSMEAFLAAWLPKFLRKGCGFAIHPYRGKHTLLRKIENRLRAYAKMSAEYRIVVLVDRDEKKCKELKSRLEQICASAGLRSRRAVGGIDWQVVSVKCLAPLVAAVGMCSTAR